MFAQVRQFMLTSVEGTSQSGQSAASPAGLGWMERARCVGQGRLFFPPPGESPGRRQRREAAALEVCQACEVRAPCLRFGLSEPLREGVWGGTTDADRVRLPAAKAVHRRLFDGLVG